MGKTLSAGVGFCSGSTQLKISVRFGSSSLQAQNIWARFGFGPHFLRVRFDSDLKAFGGLTVLIFLSDC